MQRTDQATVVALSHNDICTICKCKYHPTISRIPRISLRISLGQSQPPLSPPQHTTTDNHLQHEYHLNISATIMDSRILPSASLAPDRLINSESSPPVVELAEGATQHQVDHCDSASVGEHFVSRTGRLAAQMRTPGSSPLVVGLVGEV